MSSKTIVLIGMTIGSLVGGYIPMLWGAGVLSMASLIGNTLGGIVGIYLGWQVASNIG